jgi:hypothetical protein
VVQSGLLTERDILIRLSKIHETPAAPAQPDDSLPPDKADLLVEHILSIFNVTESRRIQLVLVVMNKAQHMPESTTDCEGKSL